MSKFESNPYSLAVLLLIKVFFKLPDKIRFNLFGANSPLLLKRGTNLVEKSSLNEKQGERLILFCLIFVNELFPCLMEASPIPPQENI